MAGEIGAYSRWAKYDGKAHAERMQAGLLDSFRRQALEADPDVVEPELTRRAECLRKAHMRRLALLSSKARSKRAAA
jgi:hypothetical protein